MRIATAAMLVIVAVGVMGCSHSAQTTGTVLPYVQPTMIDQPAPDIPFLALNGKPSSLHAVRQPIAVVAFYTPPPGQCTALAPELRTLGQRYNMMPVSVVQVSEPVGPCKHAGCMQTGNYPDLHLISLCDPDRTALRDYGRPEVGTAFLIGSDGRIAAIAPIDDLQQLYDTMDSMASRVKDELQPSN